MATKTKKTCFVRVSGEIEARRAFVRRLQSVHTVTNIIHRHNVTVADLAGDIADSDIDGIRSLAADFKLPAAFFIM
jgi:hypothetical protein